jgi:RNA polymerase sigma-70 factor (ECF subfamily)
MRGVLPQKRSLNSLNWKSAHEFAEVYDLYAKKLWRHIFLRTSRREETNDLVAQVFLKTWEYLKTGKSIENIQAFLYRTAHNSLVDWYRSKTKVVELNSSLEEGEYDDLMVEEDPAGKILISVETRLQLHQALQRLPEPERNILIMRFIDELEISEISKILQKTKGAVSVGIHRALKVLEKTIKNK